MDSFKKLVVVLGIVLWEISVIAQIPDYCYQVPLCNICSNMGKDFMQIKPVGDGFYNVNNEFISIKSHRSSLTDLINSNFKMYNTNSLCIQLDSIDYGLNIDRVLKKHNEEIVNLELIDIKVNERCIGKMAKLKMLAYISDDKISVCDALTQSKESIQSISLKGKTIDFCKEGTENFKSLEQLYLRSESISNFNWALLKNKNYYNQIEVYSTNIGLTSEFLSLDSLTHLGFRLNSNDTISLNILNDLAQKGALSILTIEVNKELNQTELNKLVFSLSGTSSFIILCKNLHYSDVILRIRQLDSLKYDIQINGNFISGRRK